MTFLAIYRPRIHHETEIAAYFEPGGYVRRLNQSTEGLIPPQDLGIYLSLDEASPMGLCEIATWGA
jgi:hypothetical protein